MPVKRSVNESGSKAIGVGTAHTNMNGKNEPGPSNVTLSGLLNAIDGVASQASLYLSVIESCSFCRRIRYSLHRPTFPTISTSRSEDLVDSTSMSLSTTPPVNKQWGSSSTFTPPLSPTPRPMRLSPLVLQVRNSMSVKQRRSSPMSSPRRTSRYPSRLFKGLYCCTKGILLWPKRMLGSG